MEKRAPGARPPAGTGETLDWGRTAYREAWERQEERVRLRQRDRVGDALIFTEHDPVYTVGKRVGAARHLVWSEAERGERRIEVVETNRGGDITYHGPGQVVGYPIVSLEEIRDLHRYLRLLEQTLINAVGALGLAASRREGMTGIWLGDRKLAAIGVAVKRWVTLHGFALNVDPDLSHFSGIVPCGITEGSVTSLRNELGAAPDPAEVRTLLAREFWILFSRMLSGGRHGTPSP